jgi:tetratricopeptide (TPR) repeat protein
VFAVVLLLGACATTRPRERSALDAQAGWVAYLGKQYGDCAKLYGRASEIAEGRAKADYVYSASTCELRDGRRSEAIAGFRRAIQIHPSYYDDIAHDGSLQTELANDPEWTALLTTFRPAYDEFERSFNAELREMFSADQKDREGGPDKIDWSVVNGRDAARRDRVRQMAGAGQLKSPDDYFFAAMIFQHGEDEASYDQAYRYATHAVELDPSFVKARWLVAASKDRYHMSRGEPQLYGTQFKRIEGKWWLWPVDLHITDAERAEWGVDPLDVSKKKLEKMNAKTPK